MRGSGRRCGLWKAWTGDEWGGQGPAGHYLQHLPGHRWRRLEVDGRVDGWGGWQLWWLRHVVHGRLLLLHAFPSLLLLRLLPHQLHAQPNARRHGGRRRWLPVDRGSGQAQFLPRPWVLGMEPGWPKGHWVMPAVQEKPQSPAIRRDRWRSPKPRSQLSQLLSQRQGHPLHSQKSARCPPTPKPGSAYGGQPR